MAMGMHPQFLGVASPPRSVRLLAAESPGFAAIAPLEPDRVVALVAASSVPQLSQLESSRESA